MSPHTPTREVGERRNVPGFRGPQTNMGPCVVCGGNVWLYDDDPRGDRPLAHKRICRDQVAFGVGDTTDTPERPA
jgi:hypothetical protein